MPFFVEKRIYRWGRIYYDFPIQSLFSNYGIGYLLVDVKKASNKIEKLNIELKYEYFYSKIRTI